MLFTRLSDFDLISLPEITDLSHNVFLGGNKTLKNKLKSFKGPIYYESMLPR
jgi:hypothetical protein